MELIALLLGMYLGAKCHVPLNVLLKLMHDKFGRFEGIAWYGLLTVLLYRALGSPGLIISLALPAVYIGWQFAQRLNWKELVAKSEPEQKAGYVPSGEAMDAVVVKRNGISGPTPVPGDAENGAQPQEGGVKSAPPSLRRSRSRAAAPATEN